MTSPLDRGLSAAVARIRAERQRREREAAWDFWLTMIGTLVAVLAVVWALTV